MRARKGRCKVLNLGEKKPLKEHGLGTVCLEKSFAEKDMGVPGREVECEA